MALLTDLYAYYKLDAADIVDDAHTNDRDLSNPSGISTTTGKINQAANTEGSGVAFTRADEAALDFTTAFSVSIWFYGTGGFSVNSVLMSKWTYSTQGGWTLACDGSDDLAFWVADALGDPGSNLGVTTDAALAGDTWHHGVFVYDGGGGSNAARAKIYLNNALKTLNFTGTIPSSLQTNTADLVIARWPGLDRYWVGRLDEIGIWSRALTADEVAELWNGGAGLPYSSFTGGGGGTPFMTRLGAKRLR